MSDMSPQTVTIGDQTFITITLQPAINNLRMLWLLDMGDKKRKVLLVQLYRQVVRISNVQLLAVPTLLILCPDYFLGLQRSSDPESLEITIQKF